MGPSRLLFPLSFAGLLFVVALPSRAQVTIGAGQMQIFSGDNPFSGGAITFGGGTLKAQGAGPYTLSNTITLNGSGTIDAGGVYGFSGAGGSNLTGVIGGSGASLSLTDSVGGGVITLWNANNFNAAVNVAGVTVGVRNSAAFGSNTIYLNGGATLNSAAPGLNVANNIVLGANTANIIEGAWPDAIYSGAISGSGSLTLNYVTIDGANTYSGGTIIGPGVAVGGPSPLGTGMVTLNGFVSIAQNGTTLANPLSIPLNAWIDLMGHSAVFSGPISGQLLIVADTVGGGVLKLSGPALWTGGTGVGGNGFAGSAVVTLQMGAAGVMPSAGYMSIYPNGTFDMNGYPQTIPILNNSGTIKTGAATLTAGSFQTSGTLAVVPFAGGPNVKVTGTASLGGTLRIAPGAPSQRYTIIQAGTLTGTFSSIVLPPGYSDLVVSYLNNELTLDLLAPSSRFSCANPNQTSIANVLNSAPSSADMTAMMNALSAAPSSALEQMSPVALSQPLRGPSYAMSKLSSNAVNQRVIGLQTGAADGSRVASYNTSGPSPYPGILVAELPGDTSAVDWEKLTKGSPWGFFASGVGTLGRLNDANSSAGFTPGYSFHAAGAALGADYRLNDNAVVGLTGGYAAGSTVINAGEGSSTSQSVRYGVYGALFDESRHVDLQLGGASDFFAVDRAIPVLGRNATSSPTGQEFNTSAHAGFDLKGDAGTLSPFASLSYDRLMINAFSESGAASADLAVEGQTAESLRSGLGAKVSRSFKSGEQVFTPYLSAGWQHEYMNQSQALTAQFAGGGGVFTVQTADVDRDGALLGLGVSLDWSKSTSFKLAYAGDLRPDFVAHTFSGTARFKF